MICDICGRKIGYEDGMAVVRSKPSAILKMLDADGKYEKMDLCRACMIAMMDWAKVHRGDSDVDG